MEIKTISSWLVTLAVWITCTHGQSIDISSAGLLQDGFALFFVSCTADVPGESNVLITSEGVGGTASFNPSTSANVRRFTPISASDSGIYSCTLLVNDIIVDTVTFGIAVAAGKLFMVSVSQQTLPAIAGADYSLTCEVTFIQSAGTATFQWLTGPDGSPIDTANEFEVTSTDMSSTLTFSPARQSQAGLYACEATVGNVTIIENATEVVVDVPAISIRLAPIGQQVLGEDFSFMCEVTIDSDLGAAISYSFTRNGDSLEQAMPFISFQPLTLADAGEYQCSVEIVSPYLTEAIILTAPSATILLTIPAPTVVLASDTPIPVPHLSSPMLTCTVTFEDVNLAISIIVTIDGPNTGLTPFPITDVDNLAEETTTYSSAATLQELEINRGNGTYTCNAQIETNELQEFITNSEIGSDSLNIIVEPLKPPMAPNITGVEVEGRSATIRWIQEKPSVDTYSITIATTPSGCTASVDNITSILVSTMTSFEATDLEEFSEILVSITAINSAGEQTAVTIFQTSRAAPDGMPQAVEMVTADGISITISWDRLNCLERNTEVTGYFVTYGVASDDPVSARLASQQMVSIVGTEPDNRVFTASGLLPQTSYIFTVSANSSEGLGPAADINIDSGVPDDVGILHEGQLVTNNSIISIGDIGQNSQRIVCFTSEVDCCSSSTEMGQWVLPNDMIVPESSSGENIVVDRDSSIVGFTRIGDADVETGLLRCEIPDAAGQTQRLYVGVYSSDLADGQPTLSSGIRYQKDLNRLVCESTGGPATYVRWLVNGAETNFPSSQFITSTTDATYVNILELNDEPQNIIGSHSCQIINSRGETETSTMDLAGLLIDGVEDSYDEGDSVLVTCSTDLNFNTISWFMEGSMIATEDSMSALNFNVDSIMSTTQLMCRIESDFGSQELTIILRVEETADSAVIIGAAVGGVLGALVVLFLCAILILLICCCAGINNRRKVEKTHPAQYEMGTYRPTMPMDDDEESFENGHISTRAELVDTRENGYNIMVDAPSVEDIHTSFVNEEAIYVNSTFRARDRNEPIPVAEFESHVQQMHVGKNFETEYMLISRTPQSSYDISCIPENKVRNRFGNIFPYDNNRVVLSTISGVKGSDYINASFINRKDKAKAYIASQGPNPESLSDFWRMIWEYKIPTIAMLTRCYEGGKKKCVQYYPEKVDEQMYPGQNLSVTLTSCLTYANYTMRKMSVRNTAEPDTPPLEVTQFHFLGWPDHGVPTNAMTLISFIKQIRKSHPYESDEVMLVHCSAGVGRTGTFITLDSMLETINESGTVAIFPRVNEIREQRVLMVQTLVQYVFIYEALNEYIICGQTEILAEKMKETYEELSEKIKTENGTESNGFEQQFQLLNHMTHVIPEAKCGHAKAPYNTIKNRYSNRIPNYFTRVRLRPTAVEGSDYINASFIDGYKSTQTFIATQGPLEVTVSDFWKMIYEYRSKSIVMLCNLEEDGQEASHRYWPESTFQPEVYGKITVIKTAEEQFADYTFRKFEVTGVPPKSMVANNNLSPSFIVTQFQYLKWSEHKTPEDTASLIELIEKVMKVQMNTGNKAITVMCNNGVGRTGAFLAIYSQMERLKNDGEADIFQYIKAVRIQRAGLILDVDQYTFCHRVLMDYVGSFEGYANFKFQ